MAYSAEDIDCICLSCIHDGSAAEKFGAEFVQFAEEVSDPEKRDELFRRTPGYMSWQGENWLACCDDYCAYLGTVGIRELEELGIKDGDFSYLGIMHLHLAPGYFNPEWHYEYGGLYGISLPLDSMKNIEAYRTDKEEVERLAFYSEIKGKDPIALIDEYLLKYWEDA